MPTITMAEVFTSEIGLIYNDKSVNVLDRAVEPQKPYNVDVVKQEAIYLAAGVVLATAIIFLMFYFDRTIKTTEQIEQLFKLPIFGKVRKLETEKQKEKRKKEAEKRAKKEAKQAMKLEKQQEKLAKKLAREEAKKALDLEAEEAELEESDETESETEEKTEEAPVKKVVEIKAVGRKIIAEEKALQEKLAAEKEAEEAEIDETETDEIDEDSELVLRDNPKSKVSEDFDSYQSLLLFE